MGYIHYKWMTMEEELTEIVIKIYGLCKQTILTNITVQCLLSTVTTWWHTI